MRSCHYIKKTKFTKFNYKSNFTLENPPDGLKNRELLLILN